MNLEFAVAAARRRGRVSGYEGERRCVAATLGEEPCKPIGGGDKYGRSLIHVGRWHGEEATGGLKRAIALSKYP
jgi:hypothetical protein